MSEKHKSKRATVYAAKTHDGVYKSKASKAFKGSNITYVKCTRADPCSPSSIRTGSPSLASIFLTEKDESCKSVPLNPTSCPTNLSTSKFSILTSIRLQDHHYHYIGSNFSLIEFSRVSTKENLGLSGQEEDNSSEERHSLQKDSESIKEIISDGETKNTKRIAEARREEFLKIRDELLLQLHKFEEGLNIALASKKRVEQEKFNLQRSLQEKQKDIERAAEGNILCSRNLESDNAFIEQQAERIQSLKSNNTGLQESLSKLTNHVHSFEAKKDTQISVIPSEDTEEAALRDKMNEIDACLSEQYISVITKQHFKEQRGKRLIDKGGRKDSSGGQQISSH
eukprot:TRINITY_DN1412_c1_g1_i5.p1 TRINITY_DN1412_c1_g1~~TRINITY_DN1412_c1_g1_i5.p1  ORF type:complete len:340 (+),score=36.53 TRINITY_DN1412_c1_g1_i5:54-1073(+)